MLIELASHNPDLKRLLERGYALRKDGAHLVVRRVPYLDHAGELQTGAFVAKLEFVDRNRVTQDNHQVWFAGSTPYGLDGKPVPNMGESVGTLELSKADILVERRFSNKPSEGFADFFAKIEHYMNLVGGPAIAKYGVNPFTFEIDPDETPDSVFLYHDTLSSRAEIGDLSAKLADDVVAVIGLGGTGSYLVDFLAKTPIRELRGFDHDAYYVHNAFRSPGRLLDEELGLPKADVLQGRYTSFRKGILLKDAYLDRSTAPQLDGVTFAFVSVDKGSARKEIFDILAERRIPFIDVGMGLDRKRVRCRARSEPPTTRSKRLRLSGTWASPKSLTTPRMSTGLRSKSPNLMR